MKTRTALLGTALALTVCLATACGPAEEQNQDTTAPRTAECLEEKHRTHQSADTTERNMFKVTMCLNNPVVQAELEKLDSDQDNTKACPVREQHNAPRSFQSKPLHTVYAAMMYVR